MEKNLKRDPQRDNKGDTTVIEGTNEFSQENDPPSKRRIIRSQYREIETRIHEGKDEIGNGASNKFMAIMNEVENMHQHVNRPREQVSDAEALLGLTGTLVAAVKTHTSGDITPAEFISCLIRDFGLRKPMKGLSANPSNISWKNMNRLVLPVFKNAPGCRTMFGPMEIEHKQRKIVVRAKRSRLRPIWNDRPKELEKTIEPVTDTDRNIHLMFEILKKEKEVKVENLILNRTSFAQTIENLFALSFLAKDGRVRINVDGNGSQVVVPSNGPSSKDIKSGVAKNFQFIFRVDFGDWELMKTQVAEGEELMPGRDAVTVAAFADPVTVAAYADVVTVAAFPKAKAKPGDEGYSQNDANASNSPSVNTTPVKKLSRNYGHTMQKCNLTGTGEGSVLDLNSNRKRTIS